MTSGKSELLNQTSKNHKYIILLFDDETEVDDEEYFQTLPPNTLFVFSQQSGKGNGIRSRYLQHAFTIELATNLHKVFTVPREGHFFASTSQFQVYLLSLDARFPFNIVLWMS